MDSASAWRAEEFWDRGTRLVFGMADETMQPAPVRVWLTAPGRDAQP
jgi:hypothetical protein